MSIIKIFCMTLLIACQVCLAGSNSDGQPNFPPQQISEFAKQVELFAANKGARAFIISRVGRPKKDLPKGVNFTHSAVAIYSNITLENGETVQGYAIHNLYQRSDKANRSDIVMDYPIDFFWGAYKLKAGIIIPTPSLQQKLVELVANNDHIPLHNKKYSVVSNPFNSKYQNCTEYTLDMINAAVYSTTKTERLKANSKAYFKPTKIKIGGLKTLMGSVFLSEFTTSDHKGKIHTATFTSIKQYMEQYRLSNNAFEVSHSTEKLEVKAI